MSSIDERVVELQFNNGQFEAGVKESMGTLEKLKKSLNLEASADSLSGLEKAGKRFDLSNVSRNIQTVADRCSALGVIGDQVLRNLTNKAMSFGKNILTAIPNQMMAGGKKRAMNIEQAMFQMEGLLGPDEFAEKWDTINKNINEAVSGTAYGYDEAAKVAAQLKASNIDFGDDMQKILTGISGVAAMTNSSYEDIGHIFTTIAGQGKVMTQQLNQFAGRGLNVAAELAKVYKVDEATLRDMVTKGKVDFKTFALAMNDAFGEQAKKANKTFTGAMSNIKASLSRMGAQFIQPGYESLRKFFVGFNENETTGLLRVLKDLEIVIKPLSAAFEQFAESTSRNLNYVLDNIHASLSSIFPEIRKAEEAGKISTYMLKSTNKNTTAVEKLDGAYLKTVHELSSYISTSKKANGTFKVSGKEAKKLKDMLDKLGLTYKDLGDGEIEVTNLSGQVKTAWDTWTKASDDLKKSIAERVPFLSKLLGVEKEEAEVAEENKKTYKGLDELAEAVILGEYKSGDERKQKLEELGYSYGVVQNRVNELLGYEKRYEVTAEEEAKTLALLGETTEETGEKTEETKSTFEKTVTILGGMKAAVTMVSQAATALWTKVLVPFATWAGTKVLNGILWILDKIGGAFISLKNKIPDDFFDKKFEGLAEFFRNIGSAFTEFTGKVKELESVKKLIESFKKLGTAIGGFFSTGFEKISGIFSDIGKSAEEGLDFDSFLPTIDSLSEILSNAADAISAALGAVWPILEDFGLSLSNLFKTIKESETTQKLIESFGNLRDSIVNFISIGFEKITGFFTNLGKSGEEGGHKLDWLAKVVETVSNGLTWFAGKVTGVLDKITAFVQTKFTSENFEKFKDSIEAFINKTKESKPIQDLVTAFTNLATSVKSLFDAGFEKVSKNIEEAGTASEEAEPKFSWLSLIVGGVASILTTIANLANSAVTLITPLITSIGEAITNFFASEENQQKLEQLAGSFSSLRESISGLFQLGVDKLIAIFKGFGEAGEESKDGLNFEEATNRFALFADSVSMVVDSITDLVNLVIANGGDFKKGFDAWFEGIDFNKVWTDFKTNLFAAFASIFNGNDESANEEITRAGEEIVDTVSEGVEEKAKTLPQLIAEKLVALPGQIASSIRDLIAKVKTSDMLKSIKNIGIGVGGIAIGKFFINIGKGLKNFAKIPGKVIKSLDGLQGVLKGYERNLNATALLKCAFAIGILVASLWLLSKINPGELGKVLGVLAPLAIGIGVLIYALEKLKQANKLAEDAKGLTKLVNPLGLFADAVRGFLGKLALGINVALIVGSLLLIVKAILTLSETPFGKLLSGAIKLALVGALLYAFVKVVNKMSAEINPATAAGLFLLAAAIAALSAAVFILGNMKIGTLLKGGLAVAGLIVAIAYAAKVAGPEAGNMASFGSGAILLAVGLTALAVPILLYSRIKLGTIFSSLLKFALILGPLALAAHYASPAIYKLGLAMVSISKAMLRMALAVVVFAAGIALLGIAVDIFVRALVDIGDVVLNNLGKAAAGLAAFSVVILVLAGLGKICGAGLAELGVGLILIAGACFIFAAAIALLIGLSPMIKGFVEGTLSSFGELVSGIPVIGGAFEKFFGETDKGLKEFSKSLDEVGIDTDLKDDLVSKFAELQNLSGEDFAIGVDNLMAEINGLDITDEEKQRIIKDYLDGLEISATDNYEIKVKGLKAAIEGLTEDNVSLSKLGFAQLYSSVANLLDYTDDSDQFHLMLGDIEAQIDNFPMARTTKGKILASLRKLESSGLSDKQKKIELEKVLLYIEGLDYQGEAQTAVQQAFDDVVTAEGEENLSIAVRHADATIQNMALTDANKNALSSLLSLAANEVDPEKRKVILNSALLRINRLDWDDEALNAFVEEVGRLTGLSDETFEEEWQKIQEKYEGVFSAEALQEIYSRAAEAAEELQDIVHIRIKKAEATIDEVVVESKEIDTEEEKEAVKEALQERFNGIKEALTSGDITEANKLYAEFISELYSPTENEFTGLSAEGKKTIKDEAGSFITAVNEAFTEALKEEQNPDASFNSFIVGNKAFGIKQESDLDWPIRIHLINDNKLTESEFDEIIKGLQESGVTPQSFISGFQEMDIDIQTLAYTLFPKLKKMPGDPLENLSALSIADLNTDVLKTYFFGDGTNFREAGEEGAAFLSGSIIEGMENFPELVDKTNKFVEVAKKKVGEVINNLLSGDYIIKAPAEETETEAEETAKKAGGKDAEKIVDGYIEAFDEQLRSLTGGHYSASMSVLDLFDGIEGIDLTNEDTIKKLFPDLDTQDGAEIDLGTLYVKDMDLEGFHEILANSVEDSSSEVKDAAETLGDNTVEGYAESIEAGQGRVESVNSNLGGWGIDALKDRLIIKSPSKAYEELGRYSVEGYAQGWKNNEGLVTDAISTVMAGALQSAAGGSPLFSSIFGVTDDDSEIALAMSLLQGLNTASKEAGKTNTKPIFANMLKGVSIDTLPGTINDLDESLQGLKKTLESFKDSDVDIGSILNPIAEDLAGVGLILAPVGSTLLKVAVAFSLVSTALLSIVGSLSDSEGLDALSNNIPKFTQLFVDFCENIKENAPEIISAFTGMLGALGTELVAYIPIFSERAVELVITTIDSICYALINNTDKILVSLFKISAVILDAVLSVVQTIVAEIPGLGAVWSDQIETLREALREKLSPEGAEEAALNYTSGLKTGLSKGFESATEAMEAAMEGKGFKPFSVVENAFMFSNGDLQKAVDHIKEQLSQRDISPADIVEGMIPPEGMTSDDLMKLLFPDGVTFDEKAFESLLVQAGAFSMDGLASGITDSKVAENAMTEKARAVVTAWDKYTMTSSPSRLFMQKGRFLIQGLANGIKANSIAAEGAMRVIAVKCLNAIVGKLRDFNTAGRNLAMQLANGLKSGGSQVLASTRVLGNNAIDGIKDKLGTGTGEDTEGYKLGKNFGVGFVKGINSQIEAAKLAGRNLAKAPKSQMQGDLEIESPSRVAMQIGSYFGEGFVIGIQKFNEKAGQAGANMADAAIEALRSPLTIVQDILNGELEVDPTIRPVMDLSEIQNGVGLINGMSPAMSVGIGSISASMNSRKTNPNEEVISAIHLLGDKLNQPSNIYNVNGITYDDGSNISDAVRGLIRAARVERRR